MTTPPGLDMQALRQIAARRRGPVAHNHLIDRIGKHLDTHDGYVSWSGGKDSTVVVDLARQVDPHIPIVFFDNGLQFPETLNYIADLTDEWNLNLELIPTEPGLLDVLAACGGFDHQAPDRRLREELADVMIIQPAQRAHARHGPGSMWGVRADESQGRNFLYRRRWGEQAALHQELSAKEVRAQFAGVVHRRNGTVTYGPIWDWTRERVFEYLAGRGIPPNPLYAKLAALGAPEHLIRVDSIIDADKLSNGHVAWLQKGWPDLFDQLADVLPRLRECV